MCARVTWHLALCTTRPAGTCTGRTWQFRLVQGGWLQLPKVEGLLGTGGRWGVALAALAGPEWPTTRLAWRTVRLARLPRHACLLVVCFQCLFVCVFVCMFVLRFVCWFVCVLWTCFVDSIY